MGSWVHGARDVRVVHGRVRGVDHHGLRTQHDGWHKRIIQSICDLRRVIGCGARWLFGVDDALHRNAGTQPCDMHGDGASRAVQHCGLLRLPCRCNICHGTCDAPRHANDDSRRRGSGRRRYEGRPQVSGEAPFRRRRSVREVQPPSLDRIVCLPDDRSGRDALHGNDVAVRTVLHELRPCPHFRVDDHRRRRCRGRSLHRHPGRSPRPGHVGAPARGRGRHHRPRGELHALRRHAGGVVQLHGRQVHFPAVRPRPHL